MDPLEAQETIKRNNRTLELFENCWLFEKSLDDVEYISALIEQNAECVKALQSIGKFAV